MKNYPFVFSWNSGADVVFECSQQTWAGMKSMYEMYNEMTNHYMFIYEDVEQIPSAVLNSVTSFRTEAK